jgi:DNA-directed RNA polymerase specialized sigma24 family protein
MKYGPGDRVERLLALLLLQNMKTSSMATKATELSLAGFTNVEIADLLQTNTASVNQRLYEARKSKSK